MEKNDIKSTPDVSQPIEDPPTKLDLSKPNPDGAEFASHIPTPLLTYVGAGKSWRVKGQWRGKARNAKRGWDGGRNGWSVGGQTTSFAHWFIFRLLSV